MSRTQRTRTAPNSLGNITRRTIGRPRAAVLALTLLVVLAGCGGEDDATPEVDVATTDSTLISAEGADDAESDTTADAGSEVAEVGGDLDQFCQLRLDAETTSDTFFEGSDAFDPVEMEAFMQSQIDLVNEASAIAPSEVADAVQVQVDEFAEMDSILQDFDYDIVAAGVRLDTELGGPEVEASSDELAAFLAENCPNAPEPDGDGDAVDESDPAEDSDAAPDEGDDTTDGDASGDGEFSEEDFAEAEEIVEFLSDPEGRASFIEIVSEDDAISSEQAECLVDQLTPQLILEIDLVDREGADAATPEVLALFAECGVDVVAFGSE